MTKYEMAVDMYKQQHLRWNQWALFFFGLITGIFLIWQLTKTPFVVPSFIPFIASIIFSIQWFAISTGIRGATTAWREVIRDLESFAT